jgi:hypothetical protein
MFAAAVVVGGGAAHTDMRACPTSPTLRLSSHEGTFPSSSPFMQTTVLFQQLTRDREQFTTSGRKLAKFFGSLEVRVCM